MYERFYGLKEKPFSLTPDPEFLFVNKHFRGALDNVIYGIERQEGFTAIVGDVGTGKTTLCWALLGKLDKNIRTALILNPLLNEEDMLKAILQDFGVRPRRGWVQESQDAEPLYDSSWMQGLSRKELIDELNYFLLVGSEQGIFNILILDEAQNLSLGVLEQLRILSNLETAKKKLLQIIFVGQLEFQQKLNLPQLRQLDQRITIRYSLKPLSKPDMVQYIEHRLSVAGSKGSVGFTHGALARIYSYSKGYPRLINIICDRSLLAGYSERARVIAPRMVTKAARGIRGKEKGTGFPAFRPWKLILPIAALLVLALLAALGFWIWRGSLPYLSNALFGPSSSQASTRQFAINPAAEDARLPGSAPAATKEDPAAEAATPAKETIPPPAAIGREPAPVVVLPAKTVAASLVPPAGPAIREDSPAVAASAKEPTANAASMEFAGKFLLQVHSLATKDQADAALAYLQTRGYSAFVKIEEVPRGKQWYVVYAGPYGSLELAREQAAVLRQQGKMSPIVRGY
jgi:general secretion pathway protein A